MLQLDDATLESANGLPALMKHMREQYGTDSEDLAFPAFEEFDTLQRQPGELAVDCIRRYDHSYKKLRSYDSEIVISDRVLTMACLRRLGISKEDRASILAKMNGTMTTRAIAKAIKSIFEGDVPQVKKMSSFTEKDLLEKKEAATFVCEGDACDDKTESVMYTKKFGKPMPSGVVCHRCGATGHIASECQTDWDLVMKKRKANMKQSKSTEYAGMSYEYESSNDESDGSSLIAEIRF